MISFPNLNISTIDYPPVGHHQAELRRRAQGIYNLPEKISPKYSPGETCEHSNEWSETEDKMRLLSQGIVVYTENEDKILPNCVYGRSAEGCSCILQPDTTDLLLWNLGNGEFVDTYWLQKFIRQFSTGTTINKAFEDRKFNIENDQNTSSELTYDKFLKAARGYGNSLDFKNDIFGCQNPECDGRSSNDYRPWEDRTKEHMSQFQLVQHPQILQVP